jgi:putative NADPH-quinone reductase
MSKRIALVQGHPDSTAAHLGHALLDAYAEGAARAGHQLRTIEIARLTFPVLTSPEEWERGEAPADIAEAQEAIAWAEHMVLFFPLWLGDMPALVKAFLEQVMRPSFTFGEDAGAGPFGVKKLAGRSARVVVTTGMPGVVYRYFFRAHSVRSLQRNVLGFVGFAPVRATILGGVGGLGEEAPRRWFRKLEGLGEKAA